MDQYPDNDGDGVPDAFWHRRSITEVLNDVSPPTLIVELEGPRAPRHGEVYIAGDEFVRAMVNYPAEFSFWIVKQFVSGYPTIRIN